MHDDGSWARRADIEARHSGPRLESSLTGETFFRLLAWKVNTADACEPFELDFVMIQSART